MSAEGLKETLEGQSRVDKILINTPPDLIGNTSFGSKLAFYPQSVLEIIERQQTFMSEDTSETTPNSEKPTGDSILKKVARSKIGRVAAVATLMGGGYVADRVTQSDASTAYAANNQPRVETSFKGEQLTSAEIFAGLLPKEDIKNIYVRARDYIITRDAAGNISSIDVLANRWNGKNNEYKAFNSTSMNGVFPSLSTKMINCEGSPWWFWKNNQTYYIAVESGVSTQGQRGTGILVMKEGMMESKLINLPEKPASRAVFPETNQLLVGIAGNLTLLDMSTDIIYPINVNLSSYGDNARIGAGIERASLSADKTRATILTEVYSDRGGLGLSEVVVNLSTRSIEGQPSWDYRDRHIDSFFGYVGSSGKIEEVYIADRDALEIFIADHATKQQKMVYATGDVTGIYVDDKNIVTLSNEVDGLNLKVWPKGVNPQLNPEKVSTLNISTALAIPGESLFGNNITKESKDGKTYYLFETTSKGLAAVEADINGMIAPNTPVLPLIDGILKSYESTATPTPMPTATPTKTPTPMEQIKRIFMPVVNRLSKFGW